MQKHWSRWGKLLLLSVPALLGAIGLIVDGRPVLDSLFTCIMMYVLNYSDTPPNLLVELARWIAPLATASGILLAFAKVRDKLRCWIRYRRGDSVAVYGPEERRAALLDRLGRRGIDGGDGWFFVRAQSYLLLGEEAENFDFYGRSRGRMAGCTVYLQCRTLPAQSVSDAERLSPEQMELLSELEHIRWCRYHYLNNWKHGIPENGARKDPAKRLHADLISYAALTEGEKQKDRDNIRVLLSVQ